MENETVGKTVKNIYVFVNIAKNYYQANKEKIQERS